MPFTIIRQDITRMRVDAIVNAANTGLVMGGGVCGAIFKAAGAEELQAACNKKAPIQTGEAVITSGFRLPAKYVIHAAGPVYRNYAPDESERLLRAAYRNALKLAAKKHCRSIAFPLISSGIYGYPKAEALQAATDAIRDFLADHEMEVYLAVFDRTAFEVSEQLLGKVKSYIDEKYAAAHKRRARELTWADEEALNQYSGPFSFNGMEDAAYGAAPSSPPPPAAAAPASSSKASGRTPKLPSFFKKSSSLDELVSQLDEPFNQTLFRLIDARNMKDTDVYKRANIDRKLFSKIRSGKGYMPGKRTILALAVALELTLEETDDLLERAGYALSHSQIFDVIVEYFIINGRYDVFEINAVLFRYDQPLLGAG